MSSQPFKQSDLEQLILDVMGIKTITPMIRRHIAELVLTYNMTWKEIARCIVWYTEVAKQTLNPIYGIKQVVNYREQTEQYFKQLELDQQQQAAEARKITEYQDNNIIFHIKSMPQNKRQPKQLDITDINIEGDNYD